MPHLEATCLCGECKLCRKRAYQRAWRAANPDRRRKHAADDLARIKADPEKLAHLRALQRESDKRVRAANYAKFLARERARYAADPEKYRERARAHKRDYRAYRAGLSAELRERERVRGVTRNAIQTGRLVRGLCEVCGTDERIEAHHDDYAKPLDVRWLCSTHHGEVHRKDASEGPSSRNRKAAA